MLLLHEWLQRCSILLLPLHTRGVAHTFMVCQEITGRVLIKLLLLYLGGRDNDPGAHSTSIEGPSDTPGALRAPSCDKVLCILVACLAFRPAAEPGGQRQQQQGRGTITSSSSGKTA